MLLLPSAAMLSPATMILPSACSARARPKSLPSPNDRLATPSGVPSLPWPNSLSRLPLAFRRATKTLLLPPVLVVVVWL